MSEVNFVPLDGNVRSMGEHFELKDFAELVRLGVFTPDDGSGYWATDREYSDQHIWDSTVRPRWATHVMWFSK